MLYQLHHQFKDGHTEMQAQKDIETEQDFQAWIEEIKPKYPLPDGAIWMACNEESEYFVRGGQRMKITGTTVEFSTGRKIQTMDGILGLSPDGWVCAGATESVYDPRTEGPDEALYLTPVERIELAEYMIEQWKAFAEKAAVEARPTPEQFNLMFRNQIALMQGMKIMDDIMNSEFVRRRAANPDLTVERFLKDRLRELDKRSESRGLSERVKA